jgi:hypothetical protein
MTNKTIVAGIIILTALTTTGISVMGLLQSSERLGASGIITRTTAPPLPPGTPPSPPPPEPDVEIDVYEDSSCSTVLTSVDWGEIEAGESTTASLYVLNSGDSSVVLGLSLENWSPGTAEDYMSLYWDYDGSSISSGNGVDIVLTLDVDVDCPELSSFSFDIVITGS